MKKIVMTGGGTAGHINPAIAIANTIKKHQPDSVIEIIGTSYGLENELVKKAGYEIHRIEMSGLKRSLSLSNIKTAYHYFTAPIKAKKLLKRFKPDIVLGTGGYLSWPLIKAAHSLGIPSAIHESNAIPGKAVMMLSDMVNRIYVNFPSTVEYFRDKSKVISVGNPLINDTVAHRTDELKRKLGIPDSAMHTVLSFGGSLGAEKITKTVFSVANDMKKTHPHVFFVHSSGEKKYDDAIRTATEIGVESADNIRIMKYIYNMNEWESFADIIICRAGAMTISELAALGKAAIIIPSPYVANNHQYENAKRLADKNAAILIEEKDLTKDSLINAVAMLIDDRGKRLTLAQNIKEFANPNSKKLIYNDLLNIINEKAT